MFFFAPIPEITDADMAYQAEMSVEDETGYEDLPLCKYTPFPPPILIFLMNINEQYPLLLNTIPKCIIYSILVDTQANTLASKTIHPILRHPRSILLRRRPSRLRRIFHKLHTDRKTRNLQSNRCQPPRRSTRLFRPRTLRLLPPSEIHKTPLRSPRLPHHGRTLQRPRTRPHRRCRNRIPLHGPLLRVLLLPPHLHTKSTWTRKTQQTGRIIHHL